MLYIDTDLNAFFTPGIILYAKSTLGVSRLNQDARKLIKLPQATYDALIGLILSDLHISRRSPTSNARLSFAQSGKTEKEEFFALVFLVRRRSSILSKELVLEHVG